MTLTVTISVGIPSGRAWYGLKPGRHCTILNFVPHDSAEQ